MKTSSETPTTGPVAGMSKYSLMSDEAISRASTEGVLVLGYESGDVEICNGLL